MSADGLLLVVDAGGSNTRAAVLDRTGEVLGLGTASAGNPTAAGADPASRAIALAGRQAALAAQSRLGASASGPQIDMMLVAMAGDGRLLDAKAIVGAIPLAHDATRFLPAPDIRAMYHSAALEPEGCALIAGTGSVGVRMSGGRIARVVGGTGWLLGDGGSGFWIGRRAARAVIAELDGLGPRTTLTARMLAELPVSAEQGAGRTPGRDAVVDTIVDAVYARPAVELARLAPLVFELAGEDEVAAGIVAAAREEIVRLLAEVRGPLTNGPVVLGGSVLTQGLLAAGTGWLGVDDVRVADDGLIGAAVIALEEAGTACTPVVHERIRTALAALRARP